MDNVRYMISDAANLVNVESHVLRYWEDELDLQIPRNEMGHRYYTEENLREFQKIKEWKEQGYQLKAIRILVHEERMKNMAGAAGAKKAAGTQLVASEPIHKTEIQNTARSTGDKLEQFQEMMTAIVRTALEENTEALGQEVGRHVEDKVIKEMNYLMREQDEAEEERFRKLDAAIRAQKQGRRSKEEKPKKVKLSRRERKLLNPV
ncbi:MAG: MerR family transcriptional regulator [Lachnospiraceae bacterium]|nr:MerR family transcriptional regulator [Lachnospiraceae bacterium]MCI9150726.1 MerR family transcriptional regulator [Lachnospiraceae bacterium]